MAETQVQRVDFGYFVRPAEETGRGAPRVEPVLGYLVRHDDGLLLFDTGMGAHRSADARYHPRRTPLRDALGALDVYPDEVRFVANCHLHFDHCGGNPELPGRPVFTQRVELEAARGTPRYTLPNLVEAKGMLYEELDGEFEILPGVHIVPTPGHTDGHQSLVVRRKDGTVVVAGQSHNTSASYSADVLAWRAHRDRHTPPLPEVAAWIDRLQSFDPARVVFAHDHAVWEP